MYIRKAKFEELDCIMDIYAHARAFMAETGNPKQWGATNWPPQSLIEQDIAQGKCHVCCVDEGSSAQVVGVFYYDFGHDIDATYRNITDGAWLSDAPYGVVHRIASDGSVKGVGTFCINWALRMFVLNTNKISESSAHFSLASFNTGNKRDSVSAAFSPSKNAIF